MSSIDPIHLRESSTKKKEKRVCLGATFEPGNNAVICGRGKACSESPGNLKLRRVIESFLQSYATAVTKGQKSAIVSSIMSIVQETEGGLFVKHEEGEWWEVEDGYAREKIGYMLRDVLHTKYRSSTKAKEARKKITPRFSLRGDNDNDQHSSDNIDDVIVLEPQTQRNHFQHAHHETRYEELQSNSMRAWERIKSESINVPRNWSSTDVLGASRRISTHLVKQYYQSPLSAPPMNSLLTSAVSGMMESPSKGKDNDVLAIDLTATAMSQLPGPWNRHNMLISASKWQSYSDDSMTASQTRTEIFSSVLKQHEQSTFPLGSPTAFGGIMGAVGGDEEDSSSMGTIEGDSTSLIGQDDHVLQDLSDIF